VKLNFFKNSQLCGAIATLTLTLLLLVGLTGCAAHKDVTGPEAAGDSAAGNAESDTVDSAADPTRLQDSPLTETAEGGEATGVDDFVLLGNISELMNGVDGYEEVGDAKSEEGEIVEVDPAAVAAEALEATESARIFWEQGEIDEALSTLDNAYALLLEIPDGDPYLEQEKENLRHLISRRIVEIYRSRLTSAVDLGSVIPIEINEHVEREIRSFQNGERDFFIESYRRSGLYRPMMARMMREAGLPEALSWLPLVESGFKTRALSRARALGPWQFISSTGYRYGLSRTHWVDLRMDPEESTRGAIGYLTELHGMFGDWMTALAGYNCGENRVMRVIRRQQDGYMDHFWDLFEQLPRETARYVPRFQATLLIVSDPEKYGFDLPEPLPPVSFERVAVERHVKLDDLDAALGLDKGTLSALNPALRRKVTPDKSYELKVPPGAAPVFETKLAELPAYVPPKDTYTVHRVRNGETLSTIARRYGSSVNSIVRANNLRSRNRIRAGQRLKIPRRGYKAPSPAVAVATGPAASKSYSVRRGDSLWKLASRYGTTVDRIKRDNGLRSDQLTVGQKLRINTGVPPGSKTYAVRRGDTVGKIAKAHRVSLNSVLRANGLSKSSTIFPGQVLVIPN
jgi:membrane-bound lytic murein transglycosylase D